MIPATPPGSVAAAVAAFRAGRPVVLAPRHGDRPCDAVLPAALAGTAWTAWLIRHTSGLLRVPMEPGRADELRLPALRADPGTRCGAVTVSVDAEGVGTGISAVDRALTARVLADPASRPDDLRRPGHLLPVRVAEGGGPGGAGADEAAVALCRAAGLPAVALAAGLVGAGTGLADPATAVRIAHRHGLVVADPAEVLTHLTRDPADPRDPAEPRDPVGVHDPAGVLARTRRHPAAPLATTHPTARHLEHL
ncbi:MULTISPECIES: 3,4-dihydroxy-2-butanone-4-phosphate synthase [unclassified Pseudonocardia]|uniref:3,4-dihydroxy-2-butanone-4-phosphate synthase n=1 Tax=unclassified Pseudonocardia TaxID=2619320 RepID=UPI00094B5678|nr:3,4-dihydroxy-2-butanone-4-phosphate synthase [Pseudonocardia sp. Ae707_Ps1]OLM19447.1 3,4-dihydroxy-2-butanone 4-phosphate synthase / GTP cyclohydrolase II [Pseudonocardia sp. Ae707_Ps1]